MPPDPREAWAQAVPSKLRELGYAPGGYLRVCIDCRCSHMADKRAWRCRSCADAMLAARPALPPEETPHA